jgi:glyoxylase-like metal-dependent hydrolase (beta-lactamase superfamily II)
MKTLSLRHACVALSLAAVPAAGLAQGQQDFSKVEIKTTKIAQNLYTLEGQGGTIGVLAGPDGVLMVDTQFAPLSDKIAAAIRQISDGRIRFVINTHLHGDHTGGNENFAKMGATILSRDQLRRRLAQPAPAASGAPGAAAPAGALPLLTYDAPLTIHMNGESVQVIPVPAAHTDGDTMVKFATADVLMTGDFYRSVGYPNIDRTNGGSLKGMIDGLNAVIAAAGPSTRIIPGHGPIVDRNAVAAHRDLLTGARDKIAPLVQKGLTVEQVTAAKPLAEYDGKVTGAGTTGDRLVGQLYAEIKAGK